MGLKGNHSLTVVRIYYENSTTSCGINLYFAAIECHSRKNKKLNECDELILNRSKVEFVLEVHQNILRVKEHMVEKTVQEF